MDGLKPAPPTAAVQLDSTPQGADARTSTGQSCKTPCTVNVSTTEDFTVSYALPKYEPLTVPVHVTFEGGSIVTQGTITVDPNPVVGELKPMAPPKPIRKRVRRPRTPKAPPQPFQRQLRRTRCRVALPAATGGCSHPLMAGATREPRALCRSNKLPTL